MANKKICILSIDGGGIRGILPGTVLTILEEKLQKKSGDKKTKIADWFDLLAGTSTGGILTCAYITPDKSGKPKFTAKEAVNLYLDRGDEIFDVTFKQKLLSLGGISDEKYNAKELEEALEDNFGETKLSELLKPCLITSYDIRNRNAFFFRQHRAKTDENHNFLVRDVARATSAAPTYFETARIKNLNNTPYPLIDGGVFANNPTMCSYSEARGMDFKNKVKNPTAKDMLIISIGTGGIEKPYYYKEAKDWGMIAWIKPIIDIMMAGNAETVDYHLRQIFDTLSTKDKQDYYRLEPTLGKASSEMDDASKGNLDALYQAGLDFATRMDVDKKLDEIVDKLIANN